MTYVENAKSQCKKRPEGQLSVISIRFSMFTVSILNQSYMGNIWAFPLPSRHSVAVT